MKNEPDVSFTRCSFDIRSCLARTGPIRSFASPVIVPEKRIGGESAEVPLNAADRVLHIGTTAEPEEKRCERLEVV
ncbi:MAG: hypothetical protein FJZ38_20045 [Candidatus Rokubacteria bacterium]|nr:hypothetical protein [Candidatus Rokubacteria bacterium]